MKKKIISLSLAFCLLFTCSFAHSGRTDASGGHRDNKNVSGLGYYHYHCGGNPPHLHTNGVCPYATPKIKYPSLSSPSSPSTPSSPSKPSAPTVPSVKPSLSNPLTAQFTVKKPTFSVKLNNSDINNYCESWHPFVYKDIVYIPMTSAVMNELSLTSSFDDTNGFNVNKPVIPQQISSSEKSTFLDDYIVIVSAKNENLYHKYGCSELDLSEFWAYNTELAQSYGYTPCPKCNQKNYIKY